MHTVLLLGRPNVGKSSLFNWFTGTHDALVAPEAGVTRDWREGEWRLDVTQPPQTVRLLDTAGLNDDSKDVIAPELGQVLDSLTREQIAQADVLLYVIDGKAGVLPVDAAELRALFKIGKPFVVAMNKCDVSASSHTTLELIGMGFESVAISAEHRLGLEDIETAIAEALPKAQPSPSADDDEVEVAPAEPTIPTLTILGRPNAGKSTLLNHLLGENRQLVGDFAGLTRESQTFEATFNGNPLHVVDTPGQRKRAKVVEQLEKAMVTSAKETLAEANVAVLLVDASIYDGDQGAMKLFLQQDYAIADACIEAGKPLVVGLNKWDNVSDKQTALADVRDHLYKKFPALGMVPVVGLSALTGKSVPRVIETALGLLDLAKTEIQTSRINRWLEKTLKQNPPPLGRDKRTIKLKFMSQVATNPLTFVIHGNRMTHLPEHYERYLINQLRDAFDLHGVPIRLLKRNSENPFR